MCAMSVAASVNAGICFVVTVLSLSFPGELSLCSGFCRVDRAVS